MTDLPVSVVVVSRARPEALVRCLTGVSQLQYDPFEIVVVADEDGAAAARKLPFADDLKITVFREANISAARNCGIMQAAGDVVAFIDDDAVPEPQWLRHLVAPAGQGEVAAMGGFVRGRNGISFQWRAQSVDAEGRATPLDIAGDRANVLHPPAGRAVKTEGTNMAFRRSVLIDLGGFDPAFRYYLDETDLNLRLARAGHATAIVPLAEVHHGFQANAVRHGNRVPKDLFEIGASWAVFLAKHLAQKNRPARWRAIRRSERRRLLRHMVAGGLDPWDVLRLQRSLKKGYAEGLSRKLALAALPTHAAEPFRRFPARARNSVLMPTRPFRFARDIEVARQRVAKGEIVTLLSLSPSALYHRVAFDPSGVWVQRGGLFGRSERDEPLIRMTTRSRRIEKERIRVARQRGFGNK